MTSSLLKYPVYEINWILAYKVIGEHPVYFKTGQGRYFYIVMSVTLN